MVTEAERKSAKCLDAALQGISHLAALTGTQMHVTELATDDTTGKVSLPLPPCYTLHLPDQTGTKKASSSEACICKGRECSRLGVLSNRERGGLMVKVWDEIGKCT